MAETKVVQVPWSYAPQYQEIEYSLCPDGVYRTQELKWAIYGAENARIVPFFYISEDDFHSDYAVKNVYQALMNGEISKEELKKLFEKIDPKDQELISGFEIGTKGLIGTLRRRD